MAQSDINQLNNALVGKLRSALESLINNTHQSILFDQQTVLGFTTAISDLVNQAVSKPHEHKKALEYALEACAILDSLFEQEPTEADLKKIRVRLGHLNKETALTTLGRICLGIVQALLLPVALAFDILQFLLPLAGRPQPVTPEIWGLQDTLFQAPEHPGVAMIESFCNSAQDQINQQKQQQEQQRIIYMTV